MKEARYRQIYQLLKSRIQKDQYSVGTLLPSENELCRDFSITRTTARKALDMLDREGYIKRTRGRRSQVIERRHSLGLLSVKGFSEAAGTHVETIMLAGPELASWPTGMVFPPEETELSRPAIFFSRLRKLDGQVVMHESIWFSSIGFEHFTGQQFIDGSFFKTLSQRHLIEITGSTQELHAILARGEVARLLRISEGAPVLQICIKFSTSRPGLNIYSRLYCNTETYPIGNTYVH